MPDTPFKSMTPDRDSVQGKRKGEPCEKCGALVFTGDWPFCGGDARRHERGR